jgi:hypothetical protein
VATTLHEKSTADDRRAGDGPVMVVVATRTIIVFVAVALAALLLLALVYAARSVLIQLTVAIVLAMAVEPAVRARRVSAVSAGAARVGYGSDP